MAKKKLGRPKLSADKKRVPIKGTFMILETALNEIKIENVRAAIRGLIKSMENEVNDK